MTNNDSGGRATTTQKVLVDEEEHLLTCAHLFSSDCSTVEGEAVQGYNNLGNAYGGINDKSLDITTIPDYDVNDYDDYIKDGDSPRMSGYVSEIALSDFKESGQDVHKMGRTSCFTSGTVENDKYMFSPCGSDQPYVRSTMRTKPGDSGSPHYYKWENDGDYFAATIGTHFGGESLAGAAWKVHETHGIEYGLL